MKDIKDWLDKGSKRHYRVGVMLYLKYGTNNLFKKALTTEDESPYKKERLMKELKALAETEPPSPPEHQLGPHKPAPQKPAPQKPTPQKNKITLTPTVSSPNQPANTPKQWPRSACRDDYELSLWEKAAVLLKEIAALHAYLSTAPSDYERRMYAFELLRKDDELDKVYDARDLYRMQNIKKEEPPDIEYVTDPHLMAKRIENLKKYIRRVKGDIVKLGDTEERRERLQSFVKEFNYYAEKTQLPKRDA